MITKTAMITICGRPNVGKSTLTNALLGEKIAIVSNKPQTTRNRISAVVNRGDAQLILMDTPGFHKPRNRLGDYMVQVVRESVADVDGVMLVVEPIASVGEQERALIERIRSTGAPAVLVINKIDTVEKQELLAVIANKWEENREELLRSADDIVGQLQRQGAEAGEINPLLTERAFQQFSRMLTPLPKSRCIEIRRRKPRPIFSEK